MYVAHISEENRRQSIEDHLNGVAALAKTFAEPFGASDFGFCIGRLHDAGKYSTEFQKHILNGGPSVDHSTAGAKIILDASRTGVGLMMAYCIAGHHAGLPDGGSPADPPGAATLSGRLKRTVPDFSPFSRTVSLPALLPKSVPPIQMIGKGGFTAAFLIRMLFSCLVDADFLDTERFMSGGTAERGGMEGIPALYQKLQGYLSRFESPISNLNRKRTEILNICLRKALGPKGLYTLTVPTGGGKTISSLAFALRHAVEHGMRRVIYAIPYTSIIEQNAEVFRHILGNENVLEHHSNLVEPDEEENETKEQKKLKLATENWDAPVIITTNVQFFESLFANRTSRCRKLHNIVNSVVIFDEAQMIPRDYLQPCICAISELVANYGCTAVLCSATQPALQGLFPPGMKSVELCENIPELYRNFRRTTFLRAGEKDDETLAQELGSQKQALCIVNTKKHAQVLYARLKRDGTFHLSTLMTPSHRKRKLDEIRQRLKNGETCRVVSTSLIEAGVDVDFPLVYREEAGLDSEIQAAGRCNREGKRPAEQSRVVLFRPEQAYCGHLPDSLQLPAEVGRLVAEKYADLASPEAIRCYFKTMYHVSGEKLDKKKITDQLEDGAANNFSFPFAKIADQFRFIEEDTVSILIPKEKEACDLLRRFRTGEKSRKLFRAVGPYCVSTYRSHFRALYNAGKIELLDCGIAVLSDLDLYSEETGLSFSADSGVAWFV